MESNVEEQILKYKIPLTGTKNLGVYSCIACNYICKNYNIIPYALGFADSVHGLMLIWECPKCFEKQYFHARGCSNFYIDSFLDYQKDRGIFP